MRVACRQGLVVEDVDVVDEDHIDRIDAKPLQRKLDRAHETVIAVVVDLAARWRVEELADAGALLRIADLEQAPDLGGEHVVFPLLAEQETVEARFREAEAIEWRRVIVAYARLPGRLQRLLRLFRVGRLVEIAQRRRAEAKFGEGDRFSRRRLEIALLHASGPPMLLRSAKSSGLSRANVSSSAITASR